MVESRFLMIAALCATALLSVGAPSSSTAATDDATAEAVADNAQDDIIPGKQLFANTCGFCHAKGGRKAGKGPKLAGTERSDEFIVNRIKHGKPGRMPAFGGAFSDAEIAAILSYIRSLEP